MPFIQSKTNDSSTKIYYQDCGSGQPVVLVHGWPLSHRMWEAQINALTAAGYRCIAYDRRGFGESEKPWSGYDYDTLTADLDALLTALDLQDVTLVGFSMGGGEVAHYLGVYGQQRVSKAMLISAVPPFLLKTDDNPDGVEQEVFDGMMEGVKEDRVTFLQDFGKQFVNWNDEKPPISKAQLQYSHQIAAFASPKATQDCITAFATTDFREDLTKITIPTLVVHGDEDNIVPIDVSGKKAAKMIENSQYEVIEGAPHGLFQTHTKKLNKLMLEFLKG